jgi:lysophospholipase L1-like esterase
MFLYVALGDSISIDEYTGVVGGGAASQLASRLGVELVDLTRDGNTTAGVRMDLVRMPVVADLVTITAGGNDLLLDEQADGILGRLERIADHLDAVGAWVIINTVYDPSDGDNEVVRRELGLSLAAARELRRRLDATNAGIKEIAAGHGFLLADLQRLFHGHGLTSSESWFVQVIEPNLRGATAVADQWHELLHRPDP